MSAVRLSSRRVVVAGGCLALVGCAVLLATALRGDEPKPPTSPLLPFGAGKKLTAEEYRKLYPLESIADRLGYEKEKVKELAKTVPLPVMTPETVKRLEQTEKTTGFAGFDMRRKSLALLHSQEAENFIKRDGFGLSRMPAPSVIYLDLPPAPTIPFAQPNDTAGADTTDTPLPRTGKNPAVNERRMPSVELLSDFHRYGQWDFLNPSGFGYVKDREHVAGFQAHQFRAMPNLAHAIPDRKPDAQDKERWLVSQLELVSLLKHKEPAVYVSKELPRMDNLKKAETRSLSKFETKALEALQNGEDLFADATANHIRMLGALRASKQCLECHEVRRGDLLGAFSYDLDRDPPVKAQQ